VNRGRDLACAGCGATRDEDVTFFLEDEAPEVTDEALLRAARAGADWLCAHCGSSNRPVAPRCATCGAERGDSAAREVHERPLRPEAPPPAAAARPAPRPSRRLLPILLPLGLAVLGGIAWLALRITEVPVTVAGFEWERTIEIESLRTVRESAWADEVPSDVRTLSRERAVRRHEQVQVGTQRVKTGVRDLGNGFFEDVYEERPVYEQRPVYAVRVDYEVERWRPERRAEARGSDRSPRWPGVRLGRNEREARRSERLLVLLRGDRDYRLVVPADRWEAFAPGQALTAVVRHGEVLRLR
jgi:hypothetical protein